MGWGLADQAQDRLASLALIGAEPEASDEDASAMIALIQDGMDAVADAMAQMWDIPDWALEEQRKNKPEPLLAYLTSAWPDLAHVPSELRVPTLLLCGTDDGVYESMARTARREELAFVGLDGADHFASFLSVAARQAYRDFLAEAQADATPV